LHARQCRYYLLVPLFSMLLADEYLAIQKRPRLWRSVCLIAWFTLLFHSLYPAAALMGLVLGIDLLRRVFSSQKPSRAAWRALLVGAIGALILNLPIGIYFTIWERPFGFQPGYSGWNVVGAYLLRYGLTLNNDHFPLVLFLVACAWHWRKLVQRKWSECPAEVLCLMVCGIQLFVLSATANYPFSRYLIGMAPFLLFLAAGCVLLLSGHRIWLAWMLVASIASILLVREFFHWLRLNKMSILGEYVAQDLRNELYEHLQKLSISYYSSKQTGSICCSIAKAMVRKSRSTSRHWTNVVCVCTCWW